MTARSHQLSGEGVDGNGIKRAELRYTRHFIFFCFAETVLGIQKKNLIKPERVGILVPRTGV